jgi:hypothetical protein
MKKLLVLILFATMLLSAQAQEQSTEGQLEEAEKIAREQKERVGLLLTALEILRLSVIVKDLLLAQQRIQNLQRNFNSVLAVVRKDHNAPEDKFLFDPNTMRFIRIPEKPEVKEE